MGLRMKNFNIYGGSLKIWFLGGFTKKQYIGGNCLKRKGGGLDHLQGFFLLGGGGTLAKKRGWCFWGDSCSNVHYEDVNSSNPPFPCFSYVWHISVPIRTCKYSLIPQLTFACSKSAIEGRQWRSSGVFIVNFEHIFHLFHSVSIVDFEQVMLAGSLIIM